jgi:putative membrane protein
MNKEEMTLRDHLAVSRSVLANERTLQSYVRTSLAMFVAGLSFLRLELFKALEFRVLGVIMIPTGIVLFFYGYVKYRRMAQHLRAVEEGASEERRE